MNRLRGYSSSDGLELVDIGANLTHDSFDHDRDAVLAARARRRRGADGGHRRQPRMHPQGAGAGARASGRAVRHRRRASAPRRGVHRRMRCRDASAARASGSGRGRRMRPRLLPRLLAARRSGAPSSWQLQIAVETGKPLFLHQRDAHDDFMAMMRELRGSSGGGGALLHRQASASCTTTSTRLAHRHHRLALRRTPRPAPARAGEGDPGRPADDRDRRALSIAADITPAPTPRRNEPMHLPHVARAVAAARGEAVEAVATASTATARQILQACRHQRGSE